MTWKPWPRIEHEGLARYVTPEAGRFVKLPIEPLDAAGDFRAVAQAIYETLAAAGITYAFEEYHPSEALQTIRPPQEVVDKPGRGTCLDLAALFCGVCLQYELLPVLIVVEGHALAAVSLEHGLRDWNSYRPERELFDDGPLTDADRLRKLVDQGSWLAIECTGFARSTALADSADPAAPETIGREDGMLDFERATAAGREQLELAGRPLQFALDIAVAHHAWRIEPLALETPADRRLEELFARFSASPLADQIPVRNFETLVADRTRDFVGRDYVFKAIDGHIGSDDFPSGYVLIRGEPGIGKTALMAQYLKMRGHVHHFNVATQNIRSARDFLTNVCAQLIVRYELDHASLPPEAGSDSGFLLRLLGEAVAKAGGEPVVVLVDALDEAEDTGLPPNANRLFLPSSLPDGVYFVVTMREEYDSRLDVAQSRKIHLKDEDPDNQADVQRYIGNFVDKHAAVMDRQIEAWGVSRETFVETIAERSEGNFMYVVHVLRDIRQGTITAETIDDIHSLPAGLDSYYKRHWRTMRDQDRERYEKLYEPIVCTLAVVREPVTIPRLIEWAQKITGVPLTPLRVRDVIRDWYEFLDETVNGEPRYRIYHASFQDFLRNEVGLTRFDDNIAQTALDKIPGFGDAL